MTTFTTNKNLTLPANGDDVNSWDVPMNGNFTAIDAALGGSTSLTTLTGAHTLTSTEYTPFLLKVAGTLTGNVTYNIPAGVGGEWTVKNATTGAFTVTFASLTGGGTTASITQGQTTIIYCDGTNVSFDTVQSYASNGQVLYNSSGAVIGSGNLTFDGTNLGVAGTIIAGGSIKSTATGFIFPDATTQPTAAVTAPTGSVMMYAANMPPTGWLECNGAAISRTTYSVLFGIIGTVFGVGNGTTTFNIPDMRGYFGRGWDDGAGVDPGRVFGSTQADAVQDHKHDYGIGSINVSGGPSPIPVPVGTFFNTLTSGMSTGTVGTETRPKNVAMLFIIKT